MFTRVHTAGETDERRTIGLNLTSVTGHCFLNSS
jgi:hypothetical protein